MNVCTVLLYGSYMENKARCKRHLRGFDICCLRKVLWIQWEQRVTNVKIGQESGIISSTWLMNIVDNICGETGWFKREQGISSTKLMNIVNYSSPINMVKRAGDNMINIIVDHCLPTSVDRHGCLQHFLRHLVMVL